MFYSSETMTFVTVFVLAALTLLFAPSRLCQRSKAGEPPLTAGFLPWLGVGLRMRRRNFAKYGPTFTAYAAGKRLVFTKDVVIVRHMVSNSSLADTPLADSFGLAFLRTERLVFKQEAATCHRLLHSTMAGKDLFDLRDHFLVYFEQALEQCRDGEVEFFTLVREMVFCSISRAIFGSEFPAAQMMALFFSWDDNFKGIMTGIGSRSSIRKAMPTVRRCSPWCPATSRTISPKQPPLSVSKSKSSLPLALLGI
ncbi:hypothetical protein PILCRDRAFT_705050 [Piloderma croceum F 1598]|uniref:Cytochrome P450 n=1 Tax=Piloderma croceum (strain F 1598) TaxID=765440 RepID=A0A0C3BAQ0_PILCF|nr:hypothetical protein PILCRDRAFT_705050 [Piloderma croceum F 1598]